MYLVQKNEILEKSDTFIGEKVNEFIFLTLISKNNTK